MKILAVGGGSGGHVTPLVAVLREIKKLQPGVDIRFWCDKKFAKQARQLVGQFDENIPVHMILAGKLRRYHHLSTIRHLLWPSLVIRNIADVFLVTAGFFQSLVKLIIWRPKVIFIKGGYVCLPVGIAAALLRIPMVLHDSDAHPGLTNRILARWARVIATGAPPEYYNYPSEKTKYVGIPVSSEYHQFSDKDKEKTRKEWGIEVHRPLIVITGGGLGASRINDMVVKTLGDLLKLGSVVLVSGEGQYGELREITPENNADFQLYPFISKGFASLLGCADLVVARAGATTILELAALKKPTILIPNPKLTGGHQMKNAKVYKDAGAVVLVSEEEMMDNPQVLVEAVKGIITDKKLSANLSDKFSSFARPDAAKDVAKIIIKNSNNNR
jgi:UDP-N-acetylglucosamine--N-acetylmuramyl-(pentapeptide) pyrophosphoryl-undecaprenol N-acetylglucosamine transferase